MPGQARSVSTVKRGRPSIFRERKHHRRQGEMTDVGAKAFERARARLTKLWNRYHAEQPITRASDADVFEGLSRGWDQTTAYIRRA